MRDCGAGRLLLVVDEGRIPALPIRYASVDSLFFTVFGVALAWTLPTPIGVPLLGIILWFAARSVHQALRPPSTTTALSPEE